MSSESARKRIVTMVGDLGTSGIRGDTLLSSFEIMFAYMIKPAMPRSRARNRLVLYHVINRGTVAELSFEAQDYQAFLPILVLAKARQPVKMFAFSLMPNHFHLLIEASLTSLWPIRAMGEYDASRGRPALGEMRK